MARAASARGIAFAAPAGVKPLKPTVWSCWIKDAASSGVRVGKPLDLAWWRMAGVPSSIRVVDMILS